MNTYRMPVCVVCTVFIIYGLTGCTGKRTEKNPYKLIGRQMVIPYADFEWKTSEKECRIPVETEPKIVVYYSSAGCTSCRMKELKRWKGLMEETENASIKSSIGWLFIFHTSAKDRLFLKGLKDNGFDYTIACDPEGIFEKVNILPENEIYHAFLLNEHNHILLVGSPIYSPKLWEVYKSKIYCAPWQ